MQVGGVNPYNGTNFGAVNQKYLKKFAEFYKTRKRKPNQETMMSVAEHVFFEKLPEKDARDTIRAARKYIPPHSQGAYDEYFKCYFA